MTHIRMLSLMVLSLTLAACAAEKPRNDVAVKASEPQAVSRENKPAPLKDFDECAGNLHDFGGLFLMYYAAQRKMPATLQDALTMGDALMQPSLKCPVSNQAYHYEPKGYRRHGDQRLLILFDTQPAHNGNYRALLMDPPTPGQPLRTWVVQLPPLALQTYLASTPQ